MTAPSPLIAIFGAAVRPDGRASAALERRIAYGWAAAQAHPHAQVLLSGGAVRRGPSEASLMAAALTEQGLAEARMILDEDSLDTLQSVVVATRLARAQATPVLVCSDRYHVPRIRLMLAALGVPSVAPIWQVGPPPSLRHQVGMSLRECAAIPYDLAIVLARRRALLS